jgi:hypothetical protein
MGGMMATKRLIDALDYICSIDAELEAVSALLERHKIKHNRTINKLADREKSLRSICKWNRHKYNDEAIDVLTYIDNYDEEEEDYD